MPNLFRKGISRSVKIFSRLLKPATKGNFMANLPATVSAAQDTDTAQWWFQAADRARARGDLDGEFRARRVGVSIQHFDLIYRAALSRIRAKRWLIRRPLHIHPCRVISPRPRARSPRSRRRTSRCAARSPASSASDPDPDPRSLEWRTEHEHIMRHRLDRQSIVLLAQEVQQLRRENALLKMAAPAAPQHGGARGGRREGGRR